MAKIRRVLRVSMIAAALVFTAWRTLDMIRQYRECQESLRIGDRSAADLYWTNLELDSVEIAFIVGVAGLALFLLRSKSNPAVKKSKAT